MIKIIQIVKKISLLGSTIFLMACGGSSPDESSTNGEIPLPNPTPPSTTYTDDEVMNKVTQDAIKYFWDYAHPTSKLARERYLTEDPSFEQEIVAIGGSGFGLMTLLVGIDRGYLNRAEAITRLQTMLNFLEKADRFHGAWPHWINGDTGKVVPFGYDDDGGDLVETSFLCQGLICIREYFKNGSTAEQALAQKADELWKGVDWSWYTKGGEEALYWHWSPNYAWQKNFKLEGYNECLITYVMAAASPTHTIPATAYHKAWARSGTIKSGAIAQGLPVILSHNGASGTVGPMFWAHYSYLGLAPKGLTDDYADYWTLNVNHSKIIYKHCLANASSKGYSEKIWGLTASYTRNSDGSIGYTAHQPNNDTGVISPTAALSSMPYTPTESLKFLHYLYEEKANTLVGIAGPYDAFAPKINWVAPRYLSIDQGTIAPMIENHRTALLWNLFMKAPEVKEGLLKLGFHSTQYGF